MNSKKVFPIIASLVMVSSLFTSFINTNAQTANSISVTNDMEANAINGGAPRILVCTNNSPLFVVNGGETQTAPLTSSVNELSFIFDGDINLPCNYLVNQNAEIDRLVADAGYSYVFSGSPVLSGFNTVPDNLKITSATTEAGGPVIRLFQLVGLSNITNGSICINGTVVSEDSSGSNLYTIPTLPVTSLALVESGSGLCSTNPNYIFNNDAGENGAVIDFASGFRYSLELTPNSFQGAYSGYNVSENGQAIQGSLVRTGGKEGSNKSFIPYLLGLVGISGFMIFRKAQKKR